MEEQNTADWHCHKGNYWGTIAQLTTCARCGEREAKRPNDPRRYAAAPALHTICDACWEQLP